MLRHLPLAALLFCCLLLQTGDVEFHDLVDRETWRRRTLNELRGEEGIRYVRAVNSSGGDGRPSGGKIKGVFTSEDQATDWIKANVLTPVGSLKDVALDYAYDILTSVQRAEASVGQVAEQVVFKRLGRDKLAQYDPATRTLYFSSTDNAHACWMEANTKDFQIKRKTRVPFHVEHSTDGLVLHEFGHALDHTNGGKLSRVVRLLSEDERNQLKKLAGVGWYRIRKEGHEAAAEAVCAMLLKSSRTQYIPEDLKEAITELLK